jgi:hypothetical protein
LLLCFVRICFPPRARCTCLVQSLVCRRVSMVCLLRALVVCLPGPPTRSKLCKWLHFARVWRFRSLSAAARSKRKCFHNAVAIWAYVARGWSPAFFPVFESTGGHQEKRNWLREAASANRGAFVCEEAQRIRRDGTSACLFGGNCIKLFFWRCRFHRRHKG